jgi:hypothetical protein
MVVALISGLVNPPSHSFQGIFTGRAGNGLSACWQYAILCVGAWLLMFRLLPWILGQISTRSASEDAFLLSAALSVSVKQGRPVPSWADLQRAIHEDREPVAHLRT